MVSTKKIGIIGFGNMGSAIAEQLKRNYQVVVFDKDTAKTEGVSKVEVAKDIIDLVKRVDSVLLAVKPQDFDKALNEIKGHVKGKLIISIAAGITTGYIEKILVGTELVRAMPNIGAKVGKSVTCLCKGRLATDVDLEKTKDIFGYIGKVDILEEDKMNAATAISGSGPAYYFDAIERNKIAYEKNKDKFNKDFIKKLGKVAEKIGFSKKTAKFLSHWTVIFSQLLLDKSGCTTAQLKKQVASKGGTTEAALEVLGKNGSLAQAVKAAVKRAQELSKKE